MLRKNERLDRLVREQIDIIQSREVFSFSLDAVLLANFAKVPKRKNAHIIDACSGNGVVAFLLSHQTNSVVQAIEYQEQLVDMAQRTIALNHLENKVKIIHGDYRQATDYFNCDSVDVITCNPPYFEVNANSALNEKEAYTLARHEVTLTLDDWVKQSSRLLKCGGKLFCVHRPDRLCQIMTTMTQYDLMPKRMQFVHPKHGKEANIVLIEAIKKGRSGGLIVLPPLTVFDDNNQYLPSIQAILFGEDNPTPANERHYFYVLACADNTLYAGYTTDVARREKEHNESHKGAKYTKTRRPVKVIHVEEFATRSEATQAEARFKRLTRLQKEAYMQHAATKKL